MRRFLQKARKKVLFLKKYQKGLFFFDVLFLKKYQKGLLFFDVLFLKKYI